MKHFKTIAICLLLALGIPWFAGCGSVEWRQQWLPAKGGDWITVELPMPYKTAEGYVQLNKYRTPFEHGYVAEVDSEHKFQVRTMDMPISAWQMDGFNRRAVLDLGLSREDPNSADTILDRQDFSDPNWPENRVPMAEELTIESADGKTIRNSRILIYESAADVGYWSYLLLTEVRPKSEPRSPDADRFFNSLKICNGDKRPNRC